MNRQDYLKRAEEIYDEINCWNGLENEVIKLFALFSKCHTLKHDCQELVNINYVREKIFNLLIKHPTVLAADAKRFYIEMRIDKEAQEKHEQRKTK